MNKGQRERWLNEVLQEVMAALMRDDELRQALVFKGAWVLNLHLRESRHSKDLDAAAGPSWVQEMGSLDKQEAFLQEHLPRAIRRHFEMGNPVRYTLEEANFGRSPPKPHPRGWDMIKVKLVIRDAGLTNVRSLPPAELEIAAAETYGPDAVESRDFLGSTAKVYALHRIAGEKLRAYLTSLPQYRAKMRGGTREFRVKDLHDLARIVRHHPLQDVSFWDSALREFKLACASRLVDCAGLETFLQDKDQARQRYEQDRHLAAVSWDEAESALRAILASIGDKAGFPWVFKAN